MFEQATTNGWTPLLTAADEGHSQTVRVLAELKADLNRVTHDFAWMGFSKPRWGVAACV